MATATYIINMMFIKLSIGVFLLRISAAKVYRYILWTSLVVITIWSMAVFFWDVFQCTPVTKQWDFTMQGGHCATPGEIISAAYAISVMSILSDWLYVSLLSQKIIKRHQSVTLVLTPGASPNSHAMECQDGGPSEGHCHHHPQPRHIASTVSSVPMCSS